MASKVAVCGIDLGTTTSAAAIYLPATEDKQAEVQMIRLGKSGDTIPSVVCRSPSSKIWKAGENAIAEADKDREKTHLITRSKRLVGLQYSEVLPKTLEQMLLVKKGTAGGNFKDRPIFAIGDVEVSPEQAGAEILREILRLADKKLDKYGVDKKKVMVTVPAYFTTPQVEAMKHMLKLAGLETYDEGFAREPTAALASWYEEEKGDVAKYSWFIVFDLGGGTLDISILYQRQKYDLVVVGHAGDMFLGGEDFDDIMKNLVLESFMKEHPDAGPSSVAKVGELQRACKLAKEQFQDDPDTSVQNIVVNAYAKSKSKSAADSDITLNEVVSREAYDDALSELADRCKATLEEAIKKTKEATVGSDGKNGDPPTFDMSNVDKVLMVGGSSRMLLIQKKLQDMFGDKVEILEKPELAVGRGAALLASMAEAKESGQNLNVPHALSIQETLPIGIGLEIYDETTRRVHMRIILKACSPFGSTAVDDSCYVPSATFDVIVLQGNRTDYDGLRECRRVKVFNIHQPKWAADRRKIFIRIEFHVTLDGSLRIRVGPRDTSAMKELIVNQEDINSRNAQGRRELELLGHAHIEEQERLRAIEEYYQLLMVDYKALQREVENVGETELSPTQDEELTNIREFVESSGTSNIADMDKTELEVQCEAIKDLLRELRKRKREEEESSDDEYQEEDEGDGESDGDEDEAEDEGDE